MAGQRISRGKRMLAGLSALALASAGMISLGGAAQALVDPPPLGVGNIDPDASGSITVHKHKHQGAGSEDGAIDGGTLIDDDGLDGVTFTVQKLDVDLTTTAGWDTLQNVTATAPCTVSGANTVGAVTTAVTAGGGLAEFDSLSVGAYLVCETDAPNEVVDRAAPFIVAIPFPNTEDWLYDVHVYPKNGIAGDPTKEVSGPSGLVLGSTVDFTVDMVIPTVGDTGFTSFTITDDLDAKLTPVNTGVVSVSISGVTDPLVAGTDYTVAPAAPGPGAELVITMTETGRATLAANQGATLSIVYKATVTGVGAIDNTAVVNVNGNDFGSNTVTTSWGDVVISKYDAANEETLSGAVFEIYAAATPYPESPATCASAVATGAALVIDGESTFTTGPDGKITIPGVFVSDSNTNPASAVRCYVVVETTAPVGYILPTNPNRPVAVSVGATTGVDVPVANTKQGGPDLPLTGAAGQLLMVAGGSAVLIVGAGLMVASRRRAKVQS